ELEKDRGPHARMAVRPDPSAMLFDDCFRDRQPAAGTKVSGRLVLPESVEDAVEISTFASPARIFDGKSHCMVCLFTANNDSSAFGRELDCIVKQVGKNLKNPAAVCWNRKDRMRLPALQVNGLGACLKAECLTD